MGDPVAGGDLMETPPMGAGDAHPGAGDVLPVKRPVVAIFDLDGTLVVGQTQALLVRFLRRARVVSLPFVIGTGLWFVGYKAGLVKVTEASRAKGAEVFAGLTEERVHDLMERFTEEVMVPRLHPGSTAALAEHMAEGDVVVVVSAALEPLVAALCRRLGVAEFAGARCEMADGRFTGRLLGPVPYGGAKARVAAHFIATLGADAADCWAYADHDTDLELLRSVGHPVAVNPRRGLRSEAEQKGWPILMSTVPSTGGVSNG
jgi:HAD superfamily hydrolase (TIGR01490 family)